tara:strand:+ start:6434 stop:6685 length:252 start_codon:yes stop_codon:yes gene_type:complete
MKKLFQQRSVETNPTVLIRKEHPLKNDFFFIHKKLVGTFFRVIPTTGKEVFFIQGLIKNATVFTPESGNGLIISPSCLKGIQE